jgi:hypothetical protein
MSAFTDDDLAQLKTSIERWSVRLTALIARLEASEKVCEEVAAIHQKGGEEHPCSLCDVLDAWREKAGRK